MVPESIRANTPSDGKATGVGELLKPNSFESSGDRKGFHRDRADGVDGRGKVGGDIKGQEKTKKKNEIHRDIGWQLTRTLKTSPSGRKSSPHSTYCSPSFTLKP